jgi:hypothetical protein
MGRETYLQAMSPRKAFSLAISGSFFEKSVEAFSKYVMATGDSPVEPIFESRLPCLSSRCCPQVSQDALVVVSIESRRVVVELCPKIRDVNREAEV